MEGPGLRWVRMTLRGVGGGVCDKQQTGRGLHRQLEGIRVSDRDLSDAAVAAAD